MVWAGDIWGRISDGEKRARGQPCPARNCHAAPISAGAGKLTVAANVVSTWFALHQLKARLQRELAGA